MECLSSLVSVTMAGECARRGGGGYISRAPPQCVARAKTENEGDAN